MSETLTTAEFSKLHPFEIEGKVLDDLSYVGNAFDNNDMLSTFFEIENNSSDYHVKRETIEKMQTKGFLPLWRTYIAKWKIVIADHLRFPREVVYVSLSILDRYLSKTDVDIREFRLVAICSFYISSKTMCKKFVPAKWLCRRSKIDAFTSDEVIKKEWEILLLIKWRIHTPTPQCFVRTLLHIVSIPTVDMETIVKKVSYAVELAYCEYFLVFAPPSTVALVAILEALDDEESGISERSKRSVTRTLLNLMNINSICIQKHRKALKNVLKASELEKVTKRNSEIIYDSKPPSPSPTAVLEASFAFTHIRKTGSKRDRDINDSNSEVHSKKKLNEP